MQKDSRINLNKKVSALSIKSIQKKQEVKEIINSRLPNKESLPTQPFTEKQMQEMWGIYSSKMEKEGKLILVSHLAMTPPKLKGETIFLSFPNNTIKIEVEKEKQHLLDFLRKNLQNFNIDLTIEVNEIEEKKYAYTPREKYEKLKEKNPLIEKLRQEFDLNI